MSQFNLGWIPLMQQELRKFFASKGQGNKADTALQPGAIGTTVQGYDADLAAIAALNTNGVVARTGAGTATIHPTGTAGIAVLAAADAAAARTAIAVPPINNPSFTGNVGIGTSSPGATLDVSGGDALVHGVRVGRGGGNIFTNTAVGANALAANTTGSGNTAIGLNGLLSNTTGNNNTAIGLSALTTNTTGLSNTAGGVDALLFNTTGSYNTAIGGSALRSNTTGNNNTAIGGIDALLLNTTGNNNTAIGTSALRSNTTGLGNTAIGINGLTTNTTGDNNTAIGLNGLLSNTTGNNNTAIGLGALTTNTTGLSNTAGGVDALLFNTTGNYNTAIGGSALRSNTTGSYNTAIGLNGLLSNTTGAGNIAIGETNSSGTHAPVFIPTTQNNRIVMGHTAVTNAYVQVAWTIVSDARDKTQIEPLNLGLDFVEKLNPISFKFRVSRDSEQTNGGKRYGFLAQEVLTIEGEDPVIVDTEDPEKLKMTNEELIPILVNAIQELKAEFDAYKASHP